MKFRILFLISFLVSNINGKLPEGIQTCKRSEANFQQCLSKAIQSSLTTLKDGNAEFNLPKLEPFRVKYVETETVGGTSNFYLKSTLKDVDIHGLTSGKLSRTATKFNKSYGLRVEGFVDKIQIIGDYTMNGKILVLPINGEGKCNVTMTNVTCFIDSRGKYFERDGETFLNITHFTLKLTPQHVTYYFANLFKNDQKLSATINDFMNEQWKLVTDNLLPPYMTRIGDMFADISNKIFNNIPFNKIFLE